MLVTISVCNVRLYIFSHPLKYLGQHETGSSSQQKGLFYDKIQPNPIQQGLFLSC